MTYIARDLSVLAYANGFTLWHYRTREPLVAVMSPDYFTAGYDMFRPGDFLFVNAANQSATLLVSAMDAGKISAVPLNATGPAPMLKVAA